MKQGAIILCGGESLRMGAPKALLPFGTERMLQRVVRIVAEAVPGENIVVAAAEGQELPPLPEQVTVTRDRHPNRGPLEAIACGLAALAERVDAAYLTSCDVPLLQPAFIQRMFELLADNEIVVPRDGEHHHPLAAVYRPNVLPQIEELLDAVQLRTGLLFGRCRTREVGVEELRGVDPELLSLKNVNQPADYLAALERAGVPLRADIRAALKY